MRNPERGFTLIEVLVGLAITAALVGVLFAALRLGARAQEKGSERAVLSQRMRIVADRVSFLIRGAYPFRYIPEDDQTKRILLFRGDSSSIELVTTSVDPWSESPADRMGMKRVRLFVDERGLRVRERMYMQDPEDEDAEGEEFVIDPAVTSLRFEYLRVDPEDVEESWESAWDEDDDFLPAAVRVQVRLRHKGIEEPMPDIYAVVRTGGGGNRPVYDELQSTPAGEDSELPPGHPDIFGMPQPF